MAKTIDALVTDVRLSLRDSVEIDLTNDFTDDQLKTIIYDVLVEVSNISPYQVVETALTVEDSKILDISGIEDLLEIERVEYPVGNSPRSYHNFEKIDNETIELDMDSTFSETGAAGTLTGTVTFTSGSATVTGVGTAFTTALEAGYFIKVSDGTRWYRVYSIESATSLTLEETVKSGDTGADTLNLTQYRDYVARIYCNKVHSVGTTSSTLDAKEERVTILGSVAKAMSSWLNLARTRLSEATTRIADVNIAIDNMSARITQAIADLTSGRAYIAVKQNEAIATIDAMTTEIETARTDLVTGRALIGSKRTEAVAALDSVSEQITQALDDLTSGRVQIDDERENASTAIDDVGARIDQALTDLDDGRTYINKINIGGRPQSDYGNSAARELQAANTSLGQARGYLTQATTSGRYSEYAARDMQVANTYISEARGYLALDTITDEHAGYGARQLQMAGSLLSQARGYIELSRPATEYGNQAARELSNANAYLNQSAGYAREITSQLNVARMIIGLQGMVDRAKAEYRDGLHMIVKRRVAQSYSRG